MEKENIYAGMGTSEFSHRGVDIVVNQEGMFFFKFDGFRYEFPSLKEAQKKIDKLAERYFTVNKEFCDSVLEKLDGKEQLFVKNLIEEIYRLQQWDDPPFSYEFEWVIKDK